MYYDLYDQNTKSAPHVESVSESIHAGALRPLPPRGPHEGWAGLDAREDAPPEFVAHLPAAMFATEDEEPEGMTCPLQTGPWVCVARRPTMQEPGRRPPPTPSPGPVAILPPALQLGDSALNLRAFAGAALQLALSAHTSSALPEGV
jgi:hypothetical protein